MEGVSSREIPFFFEAEESLISSTSVRAIKKFLIIVKQNSNIEKKNLIYNRTNLQYFLLCLM